MVDAGDIVVASEPADEQFVSYVCEHSGIDRDSIVVLALGRDLDDEAIASIELADRLGPLLTGPGSWRLQPAMFTESVAALAALLGLPLDAGLRFAAQRGPDLLNRKSHFRQLAAGAGVSIPAGGLVYNARELAVAIDRYVAPTGTVIVKRDNDLGGHGNRAFTTGDAVPLSGVRKNVALDGDTAGAAERLWAELADDTGRVLVVESYHPAEQIFYFEYFIDAEGRPRILASGLWRDAPGAPGTPYLVWEGLDLPADLRPATAAQALTQSAQLAAVCAGIGFRGHLNIDAILTADGRLFFNEINARFGGGTTLHHIGAMLFGERYADDHVISGLRTVNPITLPDAVELLRAHGLHYTAESGEGVLVVTYDSDLVRPTECVVVGPNRARVREIEARVRAVAGTVNDPVLAGTALVDLNEEEVLRV
jgi:hypothetical protein